VIAARPMLVACALSAAASCKTAPVRQEVPAVVAEPSARSLAEISRSVSAALNGVPVTLADDALTKESTLVIERTPRRDPSGLPAQGRETAKPERFRLVKVGPDCVLIHEGSGQRFVLHDTTCN
jgi:hypothetical protein